MAPSSTSRHTSPARSPDKAIGDNSETSLWKIVDIPGKGKGMVVIRDIAPGTFLLSEAPLITTEVVDTMKTAEQDLENALQKLSLSDQDRVWALHNNYPQDENKLTGILQSNGYPMGEPHVGGVFANIARINHSCLPNSVQHWNELLGKLTIYSVRPIARGEEITTNYINFTGPSLERKEILKRDFTFDCTCELCSLPPRELKASDDRITWGENLRDMVGNARKVHFEPDEVMKCARSLFKLYEEQGFKDGRLSSLYYDLFQICNLHSDLARARCFAKYYSDAKKMAEGADSLDVLEIKPFIKTPEKHDSFGSTKKWKTRAADVPKGLKPAAFAKWLWREDI